jgi:hypothetical protein
MASVIKRRRSARKALKLARLLAAIDSAAVDGRPVPRRTTRASLVRG